MNYFFGNLTGKSVNNSDSTQTHPYIFCSYQIYTFFYYCRLKQTKKQNPTIQTRTVVSQQYLLCDITFLENFHFFFKLNNKCPYSKDTLQHLFRAASQLIHLIDTVHSQPKLLNTDSLVVLKC